MLNNIVYWKNAPKWTPEKLKYQLRIGLNF